jgi:hypothetical protein
MTRCRPLQYTPQSCWTRCKRPRRTNIMMAVRSLPRTQIQDHTQPRRSRRQSRCTSLRTRAMSTRSPTHRYMRPPVPHHHRTAPQPHSSHKSTTSLYTQRKSPPNLRIPANSCIRWAALQRRYKKSQLRTANTWPWLHRIHLSSLRLTHTPQYTCKRLAGWHRRRRRCRNRIARTIRPYQNTSTPLLQQRNTRPSSCTPLVLQ